MLVIGIAGGVACGKSLIADMFGQLGATVINVDQIGHQVLHLAEVKQSIRDQWGQAVLDEQGNVVRKLLAAVVFERQDNNSEDQLLILERITHPRIAEIVKKQIDSLEKDGNVPAVVLDAPVMFKAGWDKFCDKIVFVDVPFVMRQERTMKTRNWSANEIKLREGRQLSLNEKKKRATDLIDNSGSIDQTFDQVKDLWSQWGLTID